MNALTRSVLALFAVAGLVACSAPPESPTSSSGEELAAGPITPPPPPPRKLAPPEPPPPPPAPAWPTATEAYCPDVDPSCSAFADPSRLWVLEAASVFTDLGCTQPYGLVGADGNDVGVAFSVCVDSPEVRAQFQPLTTTCDACLPQLPAGQLYALVGGPLAKPTCPSGCPGGSGSTGVGGGRASGGTSAANK